MESSHNKEKNVFKFHNNKKASGAQYRKRKAEKVDNLKKNYKKLENFFTSENSDCNKIKEGENVAHVLSDTSTSNEEDGIVSVGNVHYDEKDIDNENDDGQDGDVNDRTKETAIDYSDCGLWPIHRNIQFVDYIINIGAIQVNLDTYPRDNRRRHFSNAYYNRISFCRGQGYDNGSNTKGKKIGLQMQILDLNPLTFYLPCGSHSLNLVICDAAQSSLNSINVFGIIQRLFLLFSASTSRWNVLLSHTTNFTLKRLCETRWEAKIESLKAIRYQISSVHDALITIYETETKTPDIAHKAQTLAEQLKDYSFLVSLITWYNVLFQINVVSKAMQAKDMDLVQCAEMLKKCITFLENYRTFGFKQATVDAKELAEELNIDVIFKPLKRVR
nr:uncharacterized protein LOC100214526 [Hydra vulgaris]